MPSPAWTRHSSMVLRLVDGRRGVGGVVVLPARLVAHKGSGRTHKRKSRSLGPETPETSTGGPPFPTSTTGRGTDCQSSAIRQSGLLEQVYQVTVQVVHVAL